MSLVVNLFAGPGTGKSTIMAGLFSVLKWKGVNCEMANEWAKEKVWEGSHKVLEDQLYILGKQAHRLHRLNGQVEVIITDSPILLSLVYGANEDPTFAELVRHIHNRYHNYNVILRRQKAYVQSGRFQTEAEARGLDNEIEVMLLKNSIKSNEMLASPENVEPLAYAVGKLLGRDFSDLIGRRR